MIEGRQAFRAMLEEQINLQKFLTLYHKSFNIVPRILVLFKLCFESFKN